MTKHEATSHDWQAEEDLWLVDFYSERHPYNKYGAIHDSVPKGISKHTATLLSIDSKGSSLESKIYRIDGTNFVFSISQHSYEILETDDDISLEYMFLSKEEALSMYERLSEKVLTQFIELRDSCQRRLDKFNHIINELNNNINNPINQ